MEDADKILIQSLKQLGITIGKLQDFDDRGFISSVIVCFERITKLLDEKDNFIDMKFLKAQKLDQATHRYKVC